MDIILKRSIEWLDRLIEFDTTSRLSNLDLISDIEKYMNELGVPTRLTHDKDKTKANLWCTIGPQDIGGVVLSGHTDVVPIDGQEWTKKINKITIFTNKLCIKVRIYLNQLRWI